MKVKKLYQMSELEKAIVNMVWSDVESLPIYDSWRSYQRSFIYEDKPYKYSCKYKIEDGHLRLSEAHIEHEQVVIDIMH